LGWDEKLDHCFSGLNGVSDSTGSMAQFRQAWLEHNMFDEKLGGTIGKIYLANFCDNNVVQPNITAVKT